MCNVFYPNDDAPRRKRGLDFEYKCHETRSPRRHCEDLSEQPVVRFAAESRNDLENRVLVVQFSSLSFVFILNHFDWRYGFSYASARFWLKVGVGGRASRSKCMFMWIIMLGYLCEICKQYIFITTLLHPTNHLPECGGSQGHRTHDVHQTHTHTND